MKLVYAPLRRSESGSEAGSDARSGLKIFQEKDEDATTVNVFVVNKLTPTHQAKVPPLGHILNLLGVVTSGDLTARVPDRCGYGNLGTSSSRTLQGSGKRPRIPTPVQHVNS